MILTHEEQFKQENEYVNKQIQSDNLALSLVDLYLDKHSDFFVDKVLESHIYSIVVDPAIEDAVEEMEYEVAELEEKIEELEARAASLYSEKTSLKKKVKELEAAVQRQP